MKRPPSWQEIVLKLRREITWKRAFLLIVLTMNLRIFEFFPYVRPLEELWFVLCLLTFVFLYPVIKARFDWTFSRLELYLLSLLVVLVFFPALNAYHVFGQPLVYGVLARRSTVLICTWLLLINAWKLKWVEESDIKTVLLFLMWSVCAIFLFMRSFIDAGSIADAPIGFVLGFGTDTQVFSAPGFLFPFGVVYYGLRGIREGRLIFYLFAAAIFAIGSGSSWRASLLCQSLTLLFFLFRWKRLDQATVMLSKFAVVTFLLIGLLRVAKPGFVEEAAEHFIAAIQVTLGGSKQGVDPSADARVEEADVALPYVKAHPILGVGSLSGQWSNGPQAVLGNYFSDTDIGLLGMVFTFGLVGAVYGAAQYLFALHAALRPGQVQRPFLDGVKGYILFSALFSLSTGFYIVALETNSLFVTLLVLLSTSGNHFTSLRSFGSHRTRLERRVPVASV